jgi:hypothetical protein
LQQDAAGGTAAVAKNATAAAVDSSSSNLVGSESKNGSSAAADVARFAAAFDSGLALQITCKNLIPLDWIKSVSAMVVVYSQLKAEGKWQYAAESSIEKHSQCPVFLVHTATLPKGAADDASSVLLKFEVHDVSDGAGERSAKSLMGYATTPVGAVLLEQPQETEAKYAASKQLDLVNPGASKGLLSKLKRAAPSIAVCAVACGGAADKVATASVASAAATPTDEADNLMSALTIQQKLTHLARVHALLTAQLQRKDDRIRELLAENQVLLDVMFARNGGSWAFFRYIL